MAQRRYFILTTLLLLIAGAGTHAQLPDGTIRISGIRPAEVRFTSDGRYFMAKLSDTLRFYETATGKFMSGIPIPKVNGYEAGFLAGDTTALIMLYNWGLYYHVWDWRKGVLVDSQKVWRTVQWARLMGNGRKMAIDVPQTTVPWKQFEMWDVVPEPVYRGSFLDTAIQCLNPVFDASGDIGATELVVRVGSTIRSIPITVRQISENTDVVDTAHVAPESIRELRISSDGKRISAARNVGVQRVYSAQTLDSLFVLDVPRRSSVNVSLDFTPGSEWLVGAIVPDTGLARLELRDGRTGDLVRTIATDTMIRNKVALVLPTGDRVALYPKSNAPAAESGILIVPLGLPTTSVPGAVVAGMTATHVSPNPANGELNIEFSLEQAERVSLRLVAAHGADVIIRDLGTLAPGRYQEHIGASELPSGAYFVMLSRSNVQEAIPVLVEH